MPNGEKFLLKGCDTSVEYYKSLLSLTDAKVYDQLYKAWKKRSSCVTFSSLPKHDICKIVEAVALDHPGIFFINYYSFQEVVTPLWTKLQFQLQYSSNEIEHIQRCIAKMKHHVGKFIPHGSLDSSKIWLLYDYLSRQVEYEERGAESHSIVGCLPEYGHKAVCEGVAKTFKLLCEANGIPCIIAKGTINNGTEREGHAWNIVQCDGKYRHIDVTAQIRQAHFLGRAQEVGFLKRDGDMVGTYEWDYSLYPSCV